MKKLTQEEAAMIIMDAYEGMDFSCAFRYMDLESYVHRSDWLQEDITGRERLTDYYMRKAEAMRRGSGVTACMLIRVGDARPRTPDALYINGERMPKGTKLMCFADVGKAAALIAQQRNNDVNLTLMVPTVNEEGKIIGLHVTDAMNYEWLELEEPDMSFLAEEEK